MAVVVEGAAGDEVAIDDAGFVDVDAAADFEIELALGDGGHATSFDAVGAGGDFDAVANRGNGFVLVEEPLGEANKVGVFADVFGGAAAGKEDAKVVLGIDFGEGEVGFELVAFPFLGDGPAGADFVHDHLVGAFFGRDHDGLNPGFLEAVERIEGIEGFGGVADDDESFFIGGHGLVGLMTFAFSEP